MSTTRVPTWGYLKDVQKERESQTKTPLGWTLWGRQERGVCRSSYDNFMFRVVQCGDGSKRSPRSKEIPIFSSGIITEVLGLVGWD